MAADGPSPTVVTGLGLGLAAATVLAFILAIALVRTRRREADSRRLVECCPVGVVAWADGAAAISMPAATLLGLKAASDALAGDDADRAVLSALDGTATASLEKALAALHDDGTAFEERAVAGDGRSLVLRGERTQRGDLLWVADGSQEAELSRRLAERTGEADRLRAVLDALPLPVWWRRRDTRLAGCNTAYAEAVDADRDKVLSEGRELGAAYIERGGRALAERAARTSMAQSESHHVVIRGSRHLLEFTEIPLPGEDGGSAGLATDATGLEALQDQLADHIAAHADVLEGLHTAIAIFGADKRLKFFNTAYANLTGVDRSLLQGEPSLSEILEWLRERRRLPEYADFPAFKSDRNRWFNSLIEPIEELMHLPDQTMIRSVASPHPLGGLVFAMEDVTDTLALESSYNTLIEVQRETLNNLHEGVAVFGGDGRLKLSNPELARIWNLPDEKLDGGPHIAELVDAARDFFPPNADWARLKQRIILMVTERSVRSGRLRRTDDSVVRYALVPLPDGNTVLSFLDVSDSARVERALRERNIALENADRIKSEFIGNVSYELRTPLNAIVGFTEILDNRYFGELTDRQAEYVECILQASTHLMALIDDILDLATIEAGYMALDLQPVNVHALLEGLVDVAADRAEQAGLKIKIDCPKDIGTLQADSVRLRQALFNLVSNAIQFTPSGGAITLSARRKAGEMLLTVSDTGIGIAPEHQSRVFEKFERGDPQARESGTGLGLALVKSLIELHGGSVELDSAVGKGTRALCRLPTGAVLRKAPAVGPEERRAG